MSISPAPSNPLLLAAQYRQTDLIACLLDHRIEPAPNLSDRTWEGGSVLGYGLQLDRSDDVETQARIITELLARGAQPDSIEPDVQSVTTYNYEKKRHEREKRHLAEIACRKQEPLGSLILNALGAERLKELSAQLPLLQTAVSSNSLWAARALLNAGADPNYDHPGRGLAASRVLDFEMLGVLISHGAKLTLRDSSGNYPLQVLASSRCEARVLELAVAASEAEAKGQRLNLASPPIASRAKKSEAASAPLIQGLFDAIERRQKENTASLWATLGRKRAISSRDSSGRNILHAAIRGRQWALAKRLLTAGVDANAFDQSGQTPISLFIALPYQSEEKDGRGRHRKLMAAALMPHVQWNAKDELGRGYADALWSKTWEIKNEVHIGSHASLWNAPSFDPLERGGDGLCFIERALPAWAAAKGSFEYNTPAHSLATMEKLIAGALESGRVDAPLAQTLLEHLIGGSSEPLWGQYTYQTRALAATLAPLCKRLIDLGLATPVNLALAPSLANASPDLWAAAEAWQLQGPPVPASALEPRRAARSL